MSFYDDLGVAKDADAATIKRAHRKRVKQTHPDQTGGDAAQFRKVQNAYLVLSDPDRRKRYDETGDAGEATSRVRSEEEVEHEEAMQALGGMVIQLLSEPDSRLDYEDMQARLVSITQANARNMAADKAKAETEIKRAERMAKRWKRKAKSETPDMIAAMLAAQIASIHARVAQIDRALRINDKLRSIVKEYEYAFDKPKTPDQMQGLYSQVAKETLGSYDPFGSPMFDKLNRNRR